MSQVSTSTQTFPVMEAFYTLQGEGYHTGKAAYFVRLGGCDVGCHWCDVKESWEAQDHPLKSVKTLIASANQYPKGLVVITGGEPLTYDLQELTDGYKAAGWRTHLETSGCYPLSGKWDWICFSPKKFKEPLDEFYQQADELKVVIYHPSDLAWAQLHAEKMHENCRWYLQPEWSKADQIMPLIVEYIKEHPGWNMSLQTHKYLNIP